MNDLLYCFSLERTTIAQEFYHTRLPCSRDEAHEFLALISSTKSLMLPPETNAAYRIPDTPFFVRKISTWEKIYHIFDSLYPASVEDRWLHFRQRMMAFIPVMLKLSRLERAVPETMFEIFTPTDAFLFKGPPPESRADGLVLAQIRFWSPRDSFTLVGIRFGWKDDTQLGYVYRLYSLIENYINGLIDLFDPTGDKFSFNSPLNPPNVDETTSDEIPTMPLPNPPDIFEEIDDIMMGAPHESMGLEEKYKISKPPRFYRKSLHKICKMAIARQQWIDEGVIVQDVEWTREYRGGPSRNTILKVKELVRYWNERNYRWDVIRWLHQATSHTPDEITSLVNDLRLKFDPAEWKLITDSKK